MSAARSLAVILVLAIGIPALSAAAAFAQCGGPSPSGGTRLVPTIQEGRGAFDFGRYLPRGLSIDIGLRMWLQSALVTRMVPSPVSRSALGHAPAATAPRRVWSF